MSPEGGLSGEEVYPSPEQFGDGGGYLDPSSSEGRLFTAQQVQYLLGDVQERTLDRFEKLGLINRVPKQWPKVYRYDDVIKLVETLTNSRGGDHE